MTTRVPAVVRAMALAIASLAAMPCLALSGETLDSAATFLAVFIIIAVPIGGIWLFWLVHILPEKIAEKRHHPQKDAIQVLCLLSLVFGGMLWPIAWLWAYSKPVLYKLAYGRDKSDEYYAEKAAHAESTPESSLDEELGRLRHDLEALGKQGELSGSMQAILERVARLEQRAASASTAEGAR
jgi:CBS domain containing-hemolysin-like protein